MCGKSLISKMCVCESKYLLHLHKHFASFKIRVSPLPRDVQYANARISNKQINYQVLIEEFINLAHLRFNLQLSYYLVLIDSIVFFPLSSSLNRFFYHNDQRQQSEVIPSQLNTLTDFYYMYNYLLYTGIADPNSRICEWFSG